MQLSDFYYDLPPELIAQDPVQDRSSSKLMVLNKETCTDCNQSEGSEHKELTCKIRCCRDSKTEISCKHDTDTDGYALSVSDLISENTSEERHEVNSCEEN